MTSARQPRKVAVFVDGFNLYHSLKSYNPRTRTCPYSQYRWLDLVSLCRNFVSLSDVIDSVYYFTAIYPGNPNKEQTPEYVKHISAAQLRHQHYIDALESTGIVKTIKGKFLGKNKSCPICNNRYIVNEEKLTDVNIAVSILRSCVLDMHDIALVISGDNDMIPAYRTAKELFKDKGLKIILPVSAKAKNIKSWANGNSVEIHSITEKMLKESQFPDQFEDSRGRKFFKPERWCQ